MAPWTLEVRLSSWLYSCERSVKLPTGPFRVNDQNLVPMNPSRRLIGLNPEILHTGAMVFEKTCMNQVVRLFSREISVVLGGAV